MEKRIKKIFDDLRREGVVGLAAVDKEGEVIASDLPPTAHVETFGIMTATVIGASSSANSELDRGSVKITTIDSGKGKIILANTIGDLIICVVTDRSLDHQEMYSDIHSAVDKINEFF